MDGEMFDKQKKLQYLLELGIILKGKIAVWEIALKWEAVWIEMSGSNKAHF